MTAAMTTLPVFGVPVESKAMSGVDSLYSIVQMPAGVPVGTLAIGKSGAINAALLAASVLALNDAALATRLAAWRKAADRGGRGDARRIKAGSVRTFGLACEASRAPPSAFSAADNSAACWRWRRRGSA